MPCLVPPSALFCFTIFRSAATSFVTDPKPLSRGKQEYTPRVREFKRLRFSSRLPLRCCILLLLPWSRFRLSLLIILIYTPYEFFLTSIPRFELGMGWDGRWVACNQRALSPMLPKRAAECEVVLKTVRTHRMIVSAMGR